MKDNINKLDRRIEHLLLSTQLEESGTSKLILSSILITCSTLLFLLIWAATSDLEEITFASGTIIPAHRIQPIQHLEGGIVSEVLYKKGDTVRKNATILKLNPEPAASDLKRLKNRENTMSIEISRIEALIKNNHLTAKMLRRQLPHKNLDINNSIDSLIKNSLYLLQQQLLNYESEKTLMLEKLKKSASDLENYSLRIDNIKSRLDIAAKQNQIYIDLDSMQTVSKLSLLDSVNKLKSLEGNLLELLNEQKETESKLKEAQQQLDSLDYNLKTSALEELTTLNAERIEVKNLLKKAQDQVDRLAVRAPTLGIIKSLDVKPASVISPGEILFEIVPLSGNLVIEAKIAAKDIGHIHLYDPVRVKASAFDFATYGQLSGKITFISASSYEQEDSTEPYYKATIELEKTYFGNNPQNNRLLPGMIVTAEILTAKKSIMAYLFKPIRRSLSSAFTEK